MPRSMQDEIDLEFARVEAENRRKFYEKMAGRRAPDLRDAAVELAAQMPAPAMTPPVDVNRARLLPPLESKPAGPVQPQAYCKYCGKLFKAKTVGMAVMQKRRHEKKEHVLESATA